MCYFINLLLYIINKYNNNYYYINNKITILIIYIKINNFNYILTKKIGDWGLGIGDWGLGPIPNPHPQSPF